MSIKRKGVLALTAIVILSLVLSACVTETETPEPTAVPEEPEPTEAAPAPEPTEPPPTEEPPEEVTIRLAFWELFGIIEPRMQFDVDRFNEQFPHINVEFVIAPEAFTHSQNMLTMIAAGDPPDVMWMGDAAIWDFAARGGLMDLTPSMESDGVTGDMFVPTVEDARYEGKYYALPDHGGPLMVFYNKTMYDNAGLEYPIAEPTDEWTWDTYLSNAEKITQVGADGRVEVFGTESWNIWFHWIPTIWTFGGGVITEDRTTSRLDEPEAKEAMQTVVDTMLTEPIVGPALTSYAEMGTDLLTLLLTEKCAHLGAGAWGPSLFTNPETREPVIDWGLAPYPYQVQPETIMGFVGWTIPAETAHPEEAWELLKFLATDVEVQRDIAKRGIGIPGLLEAVAYGDWLMPYEPETDLEIWQHSILRARGIPYHVQWTQTIEGVVTEEFTLMYIGEKPVEEAMNDAAARMNEILAQPLE
ncbi:MAG: extracellular solute-binding protein [Anaerolineales bacterium]|nr:extracellular solute-binding protein [Anaerolineales bacterium]